MLEIVCLVRVRRTENPIRLYYPARCDALMLHVCRGSPLPLTLVRGVQPLLSL